jgi:hypothetical protein
VSKKAKFNFFDEFPERCFELADKLQTEKLLGDLQDAEHVFVGGDQNRIGFLQVGKNHL